MRQVLKVILKLSLKFRIRTATHGAQALLKITEMRRRERVRDENEASFERRHSRGFSESQHDREGGGKELHYTGNPYEDPPIRLCEYGVISYVFLPAKFQQNISFSPTFTQPGKSPQKFPAYLMIDGRDARQRLRMGPIFFPPPLSLFTTSHLHQTLLKFQTSRKFLTLSGVMS